MTSMFQSLNLFVLSCFFLTVESQTGQILPPQNVTLRWITPFMPELSWAPPPPPPPPHSLENCTYTCAVLLMDNSIQRQQSNVKKSPWNTTLTLDSQSYWLSVKTVCDGKSSPPSIVNISASELVKDLQCVILSPKQTHCFWLTARDIPDLGFFYGLVKEDQTTSQKNDAFPTLQACSSYNYTSGVRTGCDLQANITQKIYILFNGTVNNSLVRSTFELYFKVRPPPPDWTVVKNEDKFLISWVPPDIGELSAWNFIINYTECGQIKNKTTKGERSTELNLASHCQYCISIKAQGDLYSRVTGQTPWTDKKCFDADTDRKVLVFVAIMIPLLFAGLAVLTFVCCRKNKDSIFPKVPEPRDFLSDISDNNNKGNVRNLYVPAEEEEACKITLVIDPQNNKHDF